MEEGGDGQPQLSSLWPLRPPAPATSKNDKQEPKAIEQPLKKTCLTFKKMFNQVLVSAQGSNERVSH